MIGLLLFALAGVFSILASIFNWNFFFESRKAKLFVFLFKRTGARIIYFVLGSILIVLTLMLFP